jgi:hypothetical protein
MLNFYPLLFTLPNLNIKKEERKNGISFFTKSDKMSSFSNSISMTVTFCPPPNPPL